MSRPYERHVLERTVVVRDLRLLFLPVPKAACTSILWFVSELAGLEPRRFARSARPEVTAAMTVHDLSLWRPEHRFGRASAVERERMLEEEGWLRFSVVRDPAPRLWSAWQSKLLMREPSFVEEFGDEPWFPRVPRDADEIVADFRAFVAAVASGAAADVHWAVQQDLVGQLPLNHVGRVEHLDDTVARVLEHVGDAVARPEQVLRENRSPLPYPEHAYDAAAAALLHSHYAADYEAFGYDAAALGRGMAEERWRALVEDRMDVLATGIAHSERIGQLHSVAVRRNARAHAAARKLQRLGAARRGAAAAPALPTLEGEADFDVHWAWEEARPEPGVTAVIRARDEAGWLPFVLPALFDAVERVVLVDNGSVDGTADVARAVAEDAGRAGDLEVHDYPFAIARCGHEHLGTPADSVHSLVHFYNWSFSHVRSAYALKWDADMVLTRAGVSVLRDLAWQLEGAEAVIKVPRMPLYVADEQTAFVDLGLRNNEPWGWPNRPGYRFVKAMDWEMPVWGGSPAMISLPSWCCVELKDLSADEFGHWSHSDFAASRRTQRKLREWQVFNALAENAEPPRDVVRIDAPAGTHVIDHVRDTWLPAQVPGLNGDRRRRRSPAAARDVQPAA